MIKIVDYKRKYYKKIYKCKHLDHKIFILNNILNNYNNNYLVLIINYKIHILYNHIKNGLMIIKNNLDKCL
jgi:hypothetical protein